MLDITITLCYSIGMMKTNKNEKSLPPHILDMIKKAEKRDEEKALKKMFTIKTIDPFAKEEN